jgi:hypothetical protein
MNASVHINTTAAQGIRKRIARETYDNVIGQLERAVDIKRRGPQRNGPMFRRLASHFERSLAPYTVSTECIRKYGRRRAFRCLLLLPEAGPEAESGGHCLFRLEMLRKRPRDYTLTPLSVRVSQHAVERIVMRKNQVGNVASLLAEELRPTLFILSRWVDGGLVKRPGHWRLPSTGGLSLIGCDGAGHLLNVSTWIREDQMTELQASARTEICKRFDVYEHTNDSRSIRVVCGPDTPDVCQQGAFND